MRKKDLELFKNESIKDILLLEIFNSICKKNNPCNKCLLKSNCTKICDKVSNKKIFKKILSKFVDYEYDVCCHTYRKWNGKEFDYSECTCPYNYDECFDFFKNKTKDRSKDYCFGTIDDCKIRFGG